MTVAQDEAEELRRIVKKQKDHIDSLEAALKKSITESTQAKAQVKAVAEAAEGRLKEACNLIDILHDRIDKMVDEWQSQIRNNFKGKESEKTKAIQLVEPFRPVRLGQKTLE